MIGAFEDSVWLLVRSIMGLLFESTAWMVNAKPFGASKELPPVTKKLTLLLPVGMGVPSKGFRTVRFVVPCKLIVSGCAERQQSLVN